MGAMPIAALKAHRRRSKIRSTIGSIKRNPWRKELWYEVVWACDFALGVAGWVALAWPANLVSHTGAIY